MAGNETRIDTALFIATAEQMAPLTKELTNLFNRWQETVSALRSDWQGDTSDDIRNTAAQLRKSSDQLLQSLSGYQAALKEMAGIYDKTEKNVQETGKSLKFGNTFQ